jgi:hypothetical protein
MDGTALRNAASAPSDGLPVGDDGLMALPGIVAKPDAAFVASDTGALVLTRKLDNGLLCVELDAIQAGRIDVAGRAYRLTAEQAKRFANRARFTKATQ